MKKMISPILISSLGLIAVVISSVLFDELWPAWFFVVLTLGILMLIAGGYEFYTVFRNKDIKIRERASSPDEEERELPEYRKKRAVLSKPEQELYALLKELLAPENFDIFPQPALLTVIDKITQSSYRNELFRIADFCIVDSKSTEPLALIEINDSSHQRADRIERDRKVAEICESAGLPLVTFTLDESRDPKYVSKILKRILIDER